MANDQSYKGFILLHRSIVDHWIWQDSIKLKWWLDILIQCNHSPQQVNIGYQLLLCERGQSLFSLGTWASRWRVDINTVRRFFKLLQDDKMIITENLSKTTRLTVCNYDAYNDFQQVKEKQKKSKSNEGEKPENSDRQQTIHDNALPIHDKSIDNINTVLPVINFSFDEFWNLYDKKVGDKDKLQKKWEALTDNERQIAMDHIPKYKIAQPEKKFRKDPQTYLNNKSFNDEIISNGVQASKSAKPVPVDGDQVDFTEGLFTGTVK